MSGVRTCEKCRAEIFPDEQEGLCVACLLETSLGTFHGSSLAAGDLSAVASAKLNDCGFPQIAEELGDYELIEEIGLGRWATSAHIKRFRLEAEAAASLDHPCIVPIHEIGESEGCCYFSMQLVEGRRLDEAIKREPMHNRRAAELTIKLAHTVHYAHKRGILHRDIKPGNILIDADGEPHLTDFGLARLVERESTITGAMVEALGTPSYMAPEQATGDAAQFTSATDVYGLGSVLYHLLTGQPPFVSATIYETVRLALETEPRRPRLF